MSTPLDTREEWEKEQQERDEAREDTRLYWDTRKARWETNWFIKLLLPVAIAALGAVQGYIAWTDHEVHVAQQNLELERQAANFIQLALLNRDAIESADPEKKCGFLRYIEPVQGYRQAASNLRIDASICFNRSELAVAITNYKNKQASALNPYREGAPTEKGVVRRDPISKRLYEWTCSVTSEKNAGERSGTCTLPAEIQKEAAIYRVEYSCSDAVSCGYSYNRSDSLGRQMDVDQPVGGRTIRWHRRWGGDPHVEEYILYYELPDKVVPIPKE